MKATKIIHTNKHLNTPEKRVKQVSSSVYASTKIEGISVTRKEATEYARTAANGELKVG
ncbi:MAG: hypothetical protein ABJK11_04705 [Balneola sp.]